MVFSKPRNLSSACLANNELAAMIPVNFEVCSATFLSSCERPAHHPRNLVVMGKRTNFEGDASGAHASKRQRIEAGHERNSPRPNGAGAEEVHSGRDLHKALYFDQNATADFRNGMRPFPSDISNLD